MGAADVVVVAIALLLWMRRRLLLRSFFFFWSANYGNDWLEIETRARWTLFLMVACADLAQTAQETGYYRKPGVDKSGSCWA
jgi:hypothetical protein